MADWQSKAFSPFFLFFFNFFYIYADKPPIEELHQFLEFQLPRQWAPVFSDLPLGPQRRQQNTSSLQFSLMGPKLFINATAVKLLFSKIFLICHFEFSAYSFSETLVSASGSLSVIMHCKLH